MTVATGEVVEGIDDTAATATATPDSFGPTALQPIGVLSDGRVLAWNPNTEDAHANNAMANAFAGGLPGAFYVVGETLEPLTMRSPRMGGWGRWPLRAPPKERISSSPGAPGQC